MQIHFLIGQCPAGTRLLNTVDSLSGSGALLITNSDAESTIAVDLFPYCIGESFLLAASMSTTGHLGEKASSILSLRSKKNERSADQMPLCTFEMKSHLGARSCSLIPACSPPNADTYSVMKHSSPPLNVSLCFSRAAGRAVPVPR